MTPSEAATLLSMAAAFDNRKVSEETVSAWVAALADLRFEDCRAAVVEHYKTSRDWLMPADIRKMVRRVRAKRIAEAKFPEPPSGLSEFEYRRWLRESTRAVGDGVLGPVTPLLPADPDRVRALISTHQPARHVEHGQPEQPGGDVS